MRATPTVMGSPTRSSTSRRSCAAISAGVPETRRNPPTSRNASSIDSASTSGVVCSNTSKTALLASEYADIRGGTTMACGHRLRAWRPPIAVRTPQGAPRSSRRARLPRRRSPGDRAAEDRPVARPTRRRHRGRHAGSSPRRSRTYVRNCTTGWQPRGRPATAPKMVESHRTAQSVFCPARIGPKHHAQRSSFGGRKADTGPWTPHPPPQPIIGEAACASSGPTTTR